ncbi:MAG TPA: hypothetical protein VGS60_06730 [Actinomycetes bacterium]|nr:hypothetical protein [Actinomycetes bacterium]
MSLVSYDTLTRNVRIGELTTTRDILATSRICVCRSYASAFVVTDVFGDWNRTLPTADAPELIVIARKR